KADEKVDFDFDYEFDAPKYFDFTQEKLNLETREAESWFINADTYPPSPFVLKLNLEGNATTENVNTSPKPKDAERSDPTGSHSVTDMNTNISQMDDNCRGLTFYNHMAQDIHTHPKSKHATKTSLFKSSTLMKPTASQLAKQNRRVVHGSSRILERPQTSLLQQNQKSLENLVIETQAAKRQKLEGGHLPKVVDSKQQTSLIHKMSKRGGPVDGNSVHTKLKLTIPRQPDLETAHRAQRIRPKTKNSTELGEQVMPTTSMFKARRLNRKILEAPSLPLPKKSTPRLPEFQVVGNTKASLSARSGMGDSMRPTCVDAPKQEGCETINKFRARPFNKKIFSSKGDIGVFRNTKRETTVPMEFNFSTNKKYNPPLELFDKLSLTSELQQKTGSQPKLPRPTHLPNKGSKENTVDTFQQEQRIMHAVKDNSQRFGGKQIQCKVDGEINEIGSRANMRSLGIR
ncbi:Cell cycle regulated microtubule associated protein, partial [Thalictrum thalictroides]